MGAISIRYLKKVQAILEMDYAGDEFGKYNFSRVLRQTFNKIYSIRSEHSSYNPEDTYWFVVLS